MLAFMCSWTTFRNMIMKMGVGRRESTLNPYRRYADAEAYEVKAQTTIKRLPARFTALPVMRKRASLEIAL